MPFFKPLREIQTQTAKFYENNGKENIKYQYLWNTAQFIREKYAALDTYNNNKKYIYTQF